MQSSLVSFVLAALLSSHFVAAVPQATTTASTALPTATSNVQGLNYLATNAGKLYFGTATDVNELDDTTYTGIMENYEHFGQLTPENSMKWDATEPEAGTFTFTDGDTIAALAKQYGMYLRGHNCVWYEQLPDWVTDNDYNATGLTAVIQTHVSTLVGHYKGQVYAWDVINEPLNDDGSMREDVFYDTLGDSYISIALTSAREADPNAKLYINDYNIEYTGTKSTALQTLIKQLQADDVPIDGVGMESHFIVGEVPTTLVENFQAYADLGLEFAITELDIRMELPETAALLEQQKSDYYTVVNACMQVSACKGVTVWDWTDKYSWIPDTFSGYGAACPYDSNYEPKPAFDGIAIAFEGGSL
ncbi:glycoside hydrolase family 10 protein [Laetiporus sulphureus 93-53]|uniref:Beta-xylanase n=1 Tax=Laetiporus sulphureus 93-53 TaxID=1314785 RepID=A0A165DDB1_9APHY|nr:glycoside hydrolase family 10 protein [Laetiporus sulphureus 93-53]KZT04620.1 glycoside hydrolase family 10 protein [Laetiporus sulphureus 93-53]